MPTTTLQALIVQRNSPLLEQECALCHQLFDIGDRVVICPQDATRHHSQCWETNGNHCVALACEGAGAVQSEQLSQEWDEREREEDEQDNAIIITPDEAQRYRYQEPDPRDPTSATDSASGQWRTGQTPGGGRYAVYQSNNRGCSRGCWLSFFLFNLFFCAILALGTYTFFEAINNLLQSFLAG